MKLRNIFLLIIAIFVLTDCTKKVVSQQSNTDTLSIHRPTYTYQKEVYSGETKVIEAENMTTDTLVVFYFDITDKLNRLLDHPEEKIKIFKTLQGYRIQIYYGKNRREAENARYKSYNLFPDLVPYMVHKVPTYRVKVGDFEFREDAYKYYRKFKKKFHQARIVPDFVKVITIATPDDLIELKRKEAEELRKKKKRRRKRY